MTQFGKPTGIRGKIMALGFAWGHRDSFKNTAAIAELSESDNLLEIGFGSGYFINKHAHHVNKIAGIDLSADMVSLAKRSNKKLLKKKSIDFREGTVTSLPWPDNSFTVAVNMESFFFWEDLPAALSEIARVLAPKGRLIIEMAYNLEDGLDHAKDVKKIGFKLYSEKEIREYLQNAGFTKIQVSYYQAFKIWGKGYIVPNGMIIKAYKPD